MLCSSISPLILCNAEKILCNKALRINRKQEKRKYLLKCCGHCEQVRYLSPVTAIGDHNYNSNLNMKKQAKSLLPELHEIEIKTAEFWLSTGAVRITDIGEENTYYENEFGHLFFCKNYPSYEDRVSFERSQSSH